MSAIFAGAHASASALPIRHDVTDFLSREADLLDEWRLDQWFALFDREARYTVAPLQDVTGARSASALFLINDDHQRLRERVAHLLDGCAWAERPRSRTRRLVTNVRIMQLGETVTAKASFVVYQFRHMESWEFVGTTEYELRQRGEDWSILRRATRLDHESMQKQRRISIII